MSLLDRLQYNNVNHAIVHNEEWGVSDWFVVCSKQQLRNINIHISGNYFYKDEELYLLNLRRQDIYTFYEMLTFGYYDVVHKTPTSTIWELKDNGFKKYLNRKPVRRIKVKIWIK